MSIFKQKFPKSIRCLEIASRILIVIFLIGIFYSKICSSNYEFYFFGKNITPVVWFSPLIFAIVLEVISLCVQKKRCLLAGKSGKSFLKFLLPVLILAALISIVLYAPCGSVKKAKDSRIISAIGQSRTIMDYIYDSEGNYDSFSCEHKDMAPLCQEIDENYKETDNKEPVIVHNPSTDSQVACIYSPLNGQYGKKGYWYCADSRGNAGYTRINPGSDGYCVDRESAVCPALKDIPTGGEQPPTQEQQPPADETVDWKTYRNEEYGFELKYPKNGETEELLGTHFLFYLNIYLDKAEAVLLIEENKTFITLRDFVLEPYRECGIITFAGECNPDSEANKAALSEAETNITSFQSENISGVKLDDNYYFQRDRLVYVIFMPVRQTEKDIKILEKIVSSFRFLE